MKEACIEKIQEVVASFQSVGSSSNSRSLFFPFSFYPLCPHNLSLYLITSPYVLYLCPRSFSLLISNGEIWKSELICSDVKLSRTRSFEITRIQRGPLILLLLLERDFRYYAFYMTATVYDDFRLTRYGTRRLSKHWG